MTDTHEGGCLCGTVRYRVVGTPNPTLTGVCHCRLCQRRTGSAFGISVYFNETDVEITQGVLRTYEYRSDEGHRWVKTEFCPTCGTTVAWTAEAVPGVRGVAGGTFDDPNWFALPVHVLCVKPERKSANNALQRTRLLLQFWMNLKVLVWGLVAEGER